jgi:hypothetical protein
MTIVERGEGGGKWGMTPVSGFEFRVSGFKGRLDALAFAGSRAFETRNWKLETDPFGIETLRPSL